MPFFVYLLHCSDDTYYTGWTTDPQRRLKQHNNGTGSRYTRLRRPVEMVHIEEVPDRSAALKRELAIKRLPRKKKQALAASR
mgnify:CR=1 FL=1